MPLGNRVGTAVGRQSFNFVAGSTQTATIERGQLLYGLQLNMSASLAITAATDNEPADIRLGDFEAILRNVAVRANGNDVLFSMSGNDLWHFNRYFWGRNPRVTARLGDSAAGPVSLASSLFIPFVRARSYNLEDHLLDTRRLSALNVDLTFGQATDITRGAGAAVSSTGFNITPVGFSRLSGSEPAEEPIYSPCRRYIVTATVPAAGEFTVNLPPGPIYTEFLLNGITATGASSSDQERQNVTNISLESGTTRFVEWGWSNLGDFGNNYVGAESVTNPRRSVDSDLNGWAYLPLAFGGKVSEGIDSGELGELKFRFTALAAGTMRIICSAVSPVARVGRNVALTVTPTRTA